MWTPYKLLLIWEQGVFWESWSNPALSMKSGREGPASKETWRFQCTFKSWWKLNKGVRKISFLPPHILLYISNIYGNSSPLKNQLETFCLASVPGLVFRCLSQLIKHRHLAHCLHSLSEDHHPGGHLQASVKGLTFSSLHLSIWPKEEHEGCPGDPARDYEKWEHLPRVVHILERQNQLLPRKETSGNVAPQLSV